ncbi:MAG: type II toxin-antitoxin system HicB family antitoxin [bacterium]
MAGTSFQVRIDHDPEDGLFYVECLNLQGCHTFGETRAEALEKIKEVIAGHLAVSLHVGAASAKGPSGGPDVVELVA